MSRNLPLSENRRQYALFQAALVDGIASGIDTHARIGTSKICIEIQEVGPVSFLTKLVQKSNG
jgi:hypothetical protein